MPDIYRRRHSRHIPASTVTGTFRSKHMLGERLRARSRSREPADLFKRLNFIDPVTGRHPQGREVMTALLSPFTYVEHWARQSWKCSGKRKIACFYGNMLPPLKKNHIKKKIIIDHFENKAEIRRNIETQLFQGCYTLYKQPRVDELVTQTDQLSDHVLSSILFTARGTNHRYPVHWQHFIFHSSMFVCFFPCD